MQHASLMTEGDAAKQLEQEPLHHAWYAYVHVWMDACAIARTAKHHTRYQRG